MKILVAGATGQVARALAERASMAETQVDCHGRPQFDLSRQVDVDELLAGSDAEVVVNAAAYTNVDGAESDEAAALALNAEGPGYLAAAAAAKSVPIIHLSTDYVFDGSKDRLYLETDQTAPLGAYGRTKLAGEVAVATANPRHAILRTAWVYSPFGRNFVKTMLRLADQRDGVSVVADQFGAPTSALDIADGVLAVARRMVDAPDAAASGVFHMTGTGEGAWADLAEAVFAESAQRGGPSASVTRIPSSDFPTPAARPANSRLNCDKLEAAYGVRLPNWQESVGVVVARLVEDGSWRA